MPIDTMDAESLGVKCYCKITGIYFTVLDTFSTPYPLEIAAHPRLANPRQFETLCKTYWPKLPATYQAGYILWLLRKFKLLAKLGTYSPETIPTINEALCLLPHTQRHNLYQRIAKPGRHALNTVSLNLETIAGLKTLPAIAACMRANILLMDGIIEDLQGPPVPGMEHAEFIPSIKILVKPAPETGKVHKEVKDRVRAKDSLALPAILKRIPKIIRLLEEAETIDAGILPLQSTEAKVQFFSMLPNYSALSQAVRTRLQDVLTSLLTIGISSSVIPIDSIEYKSLIHLIRQMDEDRPQHAEGTIMF